MAGGAVKEQGIHGIVNRGMDRFVANGPHIILGTTDITQIDQGKLLQQIRNCREEIMYDRNIPFYNTILKCNNYINSEIVLPKGYHFRNYQVGDEKAWARLEYEIGDFETVDMAEKYFVSQYCQNINDIKKRCIFVLNHQNQIVGSCIAWRDKKNFQTVASLHWLIVSPEHQGKNLGKALCQSVLKVFQELNEFPVYIHTQPWSYIAILLYVHLGFKLQKTDTFSHYENQYMQSMNVLKGILTDQQYKELVENSL